MSDRDSISNMLAEERQLSAEIERLEAEVARLTAEADNANARARAYDLQCGSLAAEVNRLTAAKDGAYTERNLCVALIARLADCFATVRPDGAPHFDAW